MHPARMIPVIPDHTGQPSEVPDEFGVPLDVTPDPVQMAELRPKVIEALAQVFDPEIPVNIYELGLVYDVLVDADRKVGVRMTLTAPACPAAQTLPGEVRDKARGVEGVERRPGGDRVRPAVDDGADDRRRAPAARPPVAPAVSSGRRADARDLRRFPSRYLTFDRARLGPAARQHAADPEREPTCATCAA